jgi:hypothetical protein
VNQGFVIWNLKNAGVIRKKNIPKKLMNKIKQQSGEKKCVKKIEQFSPTSTKRATE